MTPAPPPAGPRPGAPLPAADVVIVGVGMTTAVGLSAPETAAAVRAGIALFAQSSVHDQRGEPFTLAEVPEDGLPALAGGVEPEPPEPALTAREARLLRLATQPVRECLAALPAGTPAPGVVLALPSPYLTNRQRPPLEGRGFVTRLARQVGGAVDAYRSDASHVGRAGGIAALHAAAEQLRAGRAPYVVAGGVDSYVDLFVLGALDRDRRVLSADPDGFVPGEGAAFLLLTTRGRAQRAGVRPLAVLTPATTAVEEGHLYSEAPYRGEGLAEAVAALVEGGALPLPVREVYSSMTGENYWAKEWGVSFVRNRGAFDAEHGMHHPADCLGDTGAACGPLLAGLAALGIAERYRRSPCLVYASSDDGPRAAVGVLAA